MAKAGADNVSTGIRSCGSSGIRGCGSFGGSIQKNKSAPHHCSSFPFVPTNLSSKQTFISIVKTEKDCLVNKLKRTFVKRTSNKPVKECHTLEDSKHTIRELATQLERIFKHKSLIFRKFKEESCTETECQQFALGWAAELRNQPQTSTQQVAAGRDSRPPAERSSGEQETTEPPSAAEERSSGEQETTEPPSAAEERRLKEAQNILHQWAWSLRKLPTDSVCPGADVRSDLKELEGQWKKGQLANLLPVMDFIVWAVIQEQSKEGSSPELWFRTKQRSNNAVSMRFIPNTVWHWINEVSENITLDPETANQDLLLSSDKKRVRMNTIIESVDRPRDGFQRHHHKYDSWWCVLGTEGFTEGRHYWEVEVGGMRDWRIGVVKESATRNGFANLNTQTGYWTLLLQLGMLMATTSPVTKLPDSSTPSRVGVYLDMDEGHLSFYDVKKRYFIYAFNDNFTEKIYPLFGTVGTDRDLIIM